MESRIMQVMEEEVERRVAEKLKSILEHISKTYDVSIKQLLKDASTVQSNNTMCCGVTAKGKACIRRACKKSNNGFCHSHQDQKPRVVKSVSVPLGQNVHTHESGLFFVSGCPGCIQKPIISVDI